MAIEPAFGIGDRVFVRNDFTDETSKGEIVEVEEYAWDGIMYRVKVYAGPDKNADYWLLWYDEGDLELDETEPKAEN